MTALQLVPNQAQHRLIIDTASGVNSFLPEGSVVMTPDGRKSGLLAEGADSGSGELLVKGFKERDPIAKVVDLRVGSVSGTTIQVSAADGSVFNADSLGMPRGSVVMKFDGSASTRLAQGISPNQPNLTSIVLETPLGSSGELLTLFYPFPMTVSAVSMDAINLTVKGTAIQPSLSRSGGKVKRWVRISAGSRELEILRDVVRRAKFPPEAGATIEVAPFDVDVDVPAGTLVVTPDGTRESPLVFGFKAGQTGITLLAVLDSEFAASLSQGDAVLLQKPSQTLGIDSYKPEFDFPAGSLVATLDNRVRLPLLSAVPSGEVATSLRVADFASGDSVAPAGSGGRGFPVLTVEPVFDVVDLDPNFLVYSGPHRITMVEE